MSYILAKHDDFLRQTSKMSIKRKRPLQKRTFLFLMTTFLAGVSSDSLSSKSGGCVAITAFDGPASPGCAEERLRFGFIDNKSDAAKRIGLRVHVPTPDGQAVILVPGLALEKVGEKTVVRSSGETIWWKYPTINGSYIRVA